MASDSGNYYLISGIGPGAGGVGRLMRHLQARADARGFRTVFRDDFTPLRELLSRRRYLEVVWGFVRRKLLHLRFWLLVRTLSGAKVLFLHPQSAGMEALFRLAERNQVFLYVMDNSFFCMRSYNIHPEDQVECLQCLPSPEKAHPACAPFPAATPRDQEIAALKRLRQMAGGIVFLAQNSRQADLLRAALGDIRVHLVGLDTGEVGVDAVDRSGKASSPRMIVFHGATILAKGIGYFVGLAERIPEFSFVVPDSRAQVEKCLGRPVEAGNIDFRPCNWESGLGALVTEAMVVVNPSLWSAPIEGALVKSMAFNGHVATVATRYGYEGEIDARAGLLRLDANLEVAARQLRDYVQAIEQGDVSRYDGTGQSLFFPAGARDVLDVVQAIGQDGG